MSRDTRVARGCWGPEVICKIVLHEQDSHRDVSEAKSPGFSDGDRGTDWQSHHLLCLCAVADRQAATPKDTQELNDALFITKWNINEAKNMLGMPQKKKYMETYGNIEKMPASAQAAAWNGATPNKGSVPANIPAHNIDHDMYITDVKKYLQENIWSKFQSQGKKHDKDAAYLETELNYAAEWFQELLLDVRGVRTTHDANALAGSGTVAGWKNRFDDVRWADPFSMGGTPRLRKKGSAIGVLGEIFKRLQT
jgi:hypothetical protein